MQMRTLGTDLNVSAVGLGCMGFSHAYGAPTEEAEAVRLIRRAFDLGYTFFDTAEVYGTADAPHVNETLVGKALADVKNHTVIATKFGLRFDHCSFRIIRFATLKLMRFVCSMSTPTGLSDIASTTYGPLCARLKKAALSFLYPSAISGLPCSFLTSCSSDDIPRYL